MVVVGMAVAAWKVAAVMVAVAEMAEAAKVAAVVTAVVAMVVAVDSEGGAMVAAEVMEVAVMVVAETAEAVREAVAVTAATVTGVVLLEEVVKAPEQTVSVEEAVLALDWVEVAVVRVKCLGEQGLVGLELVEAVATAPVARGKGAVEQKEAAIRAAAAEKAVGETELEE
jgi:hypothetical protein